MSIYKRKIVRFFIASLQCGGTVCIDLDTFADSKDCTPELFLNPEWCPNIDDKNKFLDYDNIVEFGNKYPDYVNDIIGENKVAYTPKDNPAYIVFCC